MARHRKSSGRGVVCEAMEGRVLMSGVEPAFNLIRLNTTAGRLYPGGWFEVVAEPTHSVEFPRVIAPGASTWTPYFGTVDFYLSADAVAGNGDDVLIASGTTRPLGQGGAGYAYGSGMLTETFTPGTYHIVAKLAGTGQSLLGEAVEVDAVVPGVDLFGRPGPTSGVSGPSTWVAGDPFAYAIEVWNRGTTASTPTPVAVYLSPTPSLSTGAILMDRKMIGEVPGHGGRMYAFGPTTSYPPVAPGSYYVVAVVDPDNTVAEYDETNNVLVGTDTVTVTGPTADLAVTGVTWPTGVIWPELRTYESGGLPGGWTPPPAQYIEAQVPVSVTVRSAGSATYFYLDLVLSKDDVAGNADDLVTGEMGPFGIDGNGASGDFGGTMIVRFDGAPAGGTYRMIFRARGTSTDMAPGDNQVQGPMITVGEVDLSLTGVSTSVSTVVAGGSITSSATAHVAALASRDVTVRYSLSADGVVGNEDDIVLGTATLRAKSASSFDGELPGGSGTPPAFVVPAGTPAGVYKLVATVDPDGEVIEPDEANNTIFGPEVRVLTPELLGTLVPASGKTVAAGAPGRATLRLHNPGAAAVSRKYTVRLYLSEDGVRSSDDRLFSTQQVGAVVGAGKTGEVRLTYTLPKNVQLGTRYLIAVADVPAKAATIKKPVGKMTSARVEAAARVTVVGSRLSAVVRGVKVRGKGTAVTVRVSNDGNAAFAGTAMLRVARGSSTSALLSIRRSFTARAGKYVDFVLILPRVVSDPSMLVATVG